MVETVDIRPLKERALSVDEPLRTIILAEPDSLPKIEYFAKVATWIRLLRLSKGDKRRTVRTQTSQG